ncbi:MAG TPA: hypothetical protein VGX28_14720 [Frankiaceae bacterium]|jgi:hypothetical protein|nr:hypothetical protein [Frankiaceae bacterium]
MLRTSIAAATVLALAAAPAHGRSARSHVVTYRGTSGVAGVGSVRSQEPPVGEAATETLTVDRRVLVSVSDESGTRVPFQLYQDMTYLGLYCGRTLYPVRLPRAGGTVRALVTSGVCDGGAGTATAGTVTFRLA